MVEVKYVEKKVAAWELITMFISGTAGLVTLGKQFGFISIGMPSPLEKVMMQPGGLFFALLILLLLFIIIKSMRIER